MIIPKYSKGTTVRITEIKEVFSDWKEKEEELEIPLYSGKQYNYPKCLEWTYRVESSFLHEGEVVYHIISEEHDCHLLIPEKGIDTYKVIGHKYIGEICKLEEGKFYDVEEWTPIAGGNYIGTMAIKITAKECEYYIEKEKKDSYEWSHNSNHWFPWRNGIRIVPHVKRKYVCIGHESQCPSTVYNLKKDEDINALYKLMHYASREFEKSERIFSKEDLDAIVKDEVQKKLLAIKMKLTVKQQELFELGFKRLLPR